MKLIFSILLLASFYSLSAKDFDHSAFDALLKKIVKNDGVNYTELIKEKQKLNEYLKLLDQANLDTLDQNSKLAFYINAYNAYTIKLIIDNFDNLKSIKDISSPWSKKFCNISGKTYSLDYIEHQILRKEFKENRIHFAVNCASISCPNLQNFAFTSKDIETQLDSSTKDFINSHKGAIKANKNSLQISKIFDWYKKDFGKKDEEIIAFIQKYTDDQTLKKENPANLKISYLEYNWLLNEEK